MQHRTATGDDMKRYEVTITWTHPNVSRRACRESNLGREKSFARLVGLTERRQTTHC